MLDRRHFLRFAGLSGISLLGVPWLGCNSTGEGEPEPEKPKGDPLPNDPDKGWWVNQNYAPVEESEASDLKIEGALPPSLSGLYLRNGPNPFSGDSEHWFLGDGMVHGVWLDKGKAPWYRARYIQTDILGVTEEGPAGPPTLTGHGANTSVLYHSGRLLCLEEVGVPYEVSTKDLSTIGPFDFNEALKTAMTAHPKVDPKTGELFFFGYGLLDSSLVYHRADAKGQLLATEKIKVPSAIMAHDFQVTETHAIFMDLPIVFDLDMAISGESFPFRWAPENGARIGVMPRNGTADQVKWFNIDACFVFHNLNAFHDPQNPNVIHLDCVRYDSMWAGGPSDFSQVGQPTRFSVDIAKGMVKTSLLGEMQVEFPQISRARQGLTYRYGYSVGSTLAKPTDGAPGTLNGIFKHDLQTGNFEMFQLSPGQAADEAFFVPDPNAKNEDDGWLLSYVFDHSDNLSHLLVLDATNLKAPVARVRLPKRVPHGFHGGFVPA